MPTNPHISSASTSRTFTLVILSASSLGRLPPQVSSRPRAGPGYGVGREAAQGWVLSRLGGGAGDGYRTQKLISEVDLVIRTQTAQQRQRHADKTQIKTPTSISAPMDAVASAGKTRPTAPSGVVISGGQRTPTWIST